MRRLHEHAWLCISERLLKGMRDGKPCAIRALMPYLCMALADLPPHFPWLQSIAEQRRGWETLHYINPPAVMSVPAVSACQG